MGESSMVLVGYIVIGVFIAFCAYLAFRPSAAGDGTSENCGGVAPTGEFLALLDRAVSKELTRHSRWSGIASFLGGLAVGAILLGLLVMYFL